MLRNYPIIWNRRLSTFKDKGKKKMLLTKPRECYFCTIIPIVTALTEL